MKLTRTMMIEIKEVPVKEVERRLSVNLDAVTFVEINSEGVEAIISGKLLLWNKGDYTPKELEETFKELTGE